MVHLHSHKVEHVKLLKSAKSQISPWRNWDAILFLKSLKLAQIAIEGKMQLPGRTYCAHSLSKWFNGEMCQVIDGFHLRFVQICSVKVHAVNKLLLAAIYLLRMYCIVCLSESEAQT